MGNYDPKQILCIKKENIWHRKMKKLEEMEQNNLTLYKLMIWEWM